MNYRARDAGERNGLRCQYLPSAPRTEMTNSILVPSDKSLGYFQPSASRTKKPHHRIAGLLLSDLYWRTGRGCRLTGYLISRSYLFHDRVHRFLDVSQE